MHEHTREVLGFSLLPSEQERIRAVKLQKSFLYQALQHVEMWTCVLQTPGFKHPCSPSEKLLVKKGGVRAGILFSQSRSCHIFLINLSHAVPQMEGVPKAAFAAPAIPISLGLWAQAGHWSLVPLQMEVPGTVTNSQRQSLALQV